MTLTVREDEFSLQITSPVSPRFFVRVERPTRSATSLKISDFLLEHNDAENAVLALECVDRWVRFPRTRCKLVFTDIAASAAASQDKDELVRRHDQIVDVVKQFASRNACVVLDAFLSPIHGRMGTVAVISGSKPTFSVITADNR